METQKEFNTIAQHDTQLKADEIAALAKRVANSIYQEILPPPPSDLSNRFSSFIKFDPLKMSASLLFAAVKRDHVRILENSSFENFDINMRNEKTGETGLIVAAKVGSKKCVRFLMKKGADPLISDNSGQSGLEVVETLLQEAGAANDRILKGISDKVKKIKGDREEVIKKSIVLQRNLPMPKRFF